MGSPVRLLGAEYLAGGWEPIVLGVDSPFFSAIVLLKNQQFSPKLFVAFWKEGSLERMGGSYP